MTGSAVMEDCSVAKTEDQFSDQDFIDLDRSMAQAFPFMLIREGMLMIQSKRIEDGLIPFKEKKAQRKLNDIIIKAYQEKKPCKVIVLKSRQVGYSTDCAGVTYSLTSQIPDSKAYIVADIEAHANHIFGMQKTMHDQMKKGPNSHLAPDLKHSNARELEFDQIRSKISIASAENKKAARSGTYHFVQLSEAAYYPDLQEFLKGLQMPKEGFSLMVIESTASNFGDAFHKQCEAAWKGLIDFHFVFVPWFDDETYQMKLIDGEMYSIEGIEFDSDAGAMAFVKEELDMKNQYGLTDEQLNWRRYTIVNDCNRKLRDFRQEYPTTPEEAFQFAGGCRFNVNVLSKYSKKTKKPKAIGNLIEENGKIRFVECEDGIHKIYKFPEKWMACVLGGDAAEGKGEADDSDYSTMSLIDRCYGTDYATVRTRDLDDDAIASEAIKLARFYNNALIGFETFPSAHGYAVMKYIASRYLNVHCHIVEDKATQNKTKKLGWRNTQQSREEVIAIYEEDLREGITINDIDTINESFTFVKKTDAAGLVTGRSEHARGCHDDALFARMIAGKLRRLYPHVYPMLINKEYGDEVKGYCKSNGKKKKRKLSLANI